MARSLRSSIASVVLFGVVLVMPFLGIWPTEPWDVYAFTLLSLGVPLIGLLATLFFAGQELPKPWGLAANPKTKFWQSIIAVAISFVLFLFGWALFLWPLQWH